MLRFGVVFATLALTTLAACSVRPTPRRVVVRPTGAVVAVRPAPVPPRAVVARPLRPGAVYVRW